MSTTTTNDYLRPKYFNDAIIDKVTSLGVSPTSLVSNLARSGQLGTGIRVSKLDGATPAVFNPVVGIVLSVPTMWDRWPKLQEMLRALMETHAKQISGIDVQYSLATADTIVGHDGQNMEVPTRVSRAAVNPSATFMEYTGMPVFNLFRTWMFDIQHPDTNASILPANISTVADIPAWYMSAYSMSMLFIQYDPSGLPGRIYDAYVITNMFPKEIGEAGFERTINTTNTKERQVSFSGIIQHNENTRELGYRVAEIMNIHKINYNFALAGLGGTSTISAIQSNIRSYGGIEYESIGTTKSGSGTIKGAVTEFAFAGTSGNEAYADTLTAPSAVIPQTGAAVQTTSS